MIIRNKFLLDPARAALIVIDVQEKLCAARKSSACSRDIGLLKICSRIKLPQ